MRERERTGGTETAKEREQYTGGRPTGDGGHRELGSEVRRARRLAWEPGCA